MEGLAKDDQDPRLQLTVVTGAGRVSVSRRLLQLLSPLVREAVASLPVLATLEPLTLILPDTDAGTVTRMVELLLKGQTNVDTRQSRDDITSLAECLQIRLENIETQSKREGKIRLRNMSEILKPAFGLNYDSKVIVVDVDEKMEDDTKEGGKQDDDGCMSKPQYKCRYCGKGFEDVVLKNVHEQLSDCMSPSEISLKITQQSSDLPNISKCCHMIKTALGVLNTQHSTISTKKVIKKYITQRFKLNVTCVSGEFENKISKALRRMLASQEIVYTFGLFKLNSNGTEANNKGTCNILKKYDSLIWTAANALDNENGFSWQDILKYLQDTNKLWSGELQLCSKSMAFMVEAGLINLVRGVLGKPSAHFELAKTHTSEENEKTQL